MKKIIIVALIVASTAVLMSFMGKTPETVNAFKMIGEELVLEESIPASDCYWEETFLNNFTGKRGVSCGSDTSMKIWFTNPYSYSIRVAFYIRDSNGNYGPNAPYVVTIKPGGTRYHHSCYSNGRYAILAAKSGAYCKFPKLY